MIPSEKSPTLGLEDGEGSGTPRGLQALVVLGVILAAYIGAPFFAPTLLGGALAVTCYGPYRALAAAWARKAGGRFSAGPPLLVTLLMLFVVLLPLVTLGALVAKDVGEGMRWVQQQLGDQELSTLRVPEGVSARLQPVAKTLHLNGDDLQRMAQQAAETARPYVASVFGGSIGVPIFLALTLMAVYFFLADGHRLPDLLEDIAPMRREQTRELLAELGDVARAALLGNLVTACTQTLGLGVAFLCAGVPHPALFAMLALPASFIPVAGSALVYVPVAIGLAATSQTIPALCLLGGCAALSTANTHIIKPLVVRGGISMHSGLVFVAILGGIKAFGMIGLIAGPLGMALAWTLLRIYRREIAGR